MAIDVKGLTAKQIMDIPYEQWNKMSTEDLRILTQRLNSVANKRLKRLESSKIGKYSPALQSRKAGRMKTGRIEKFSSKFNPNMEKDKLAGKMKSKFSEVKNFLQGKTSTFKGAEEFKSKLVSRFPDLRNKTGEISEYKMSRVWKAYHAVGEMKGVHGALGQVLDSTEFQNAIAEAVRDSTYREAGMDLRTFASKVFDEMATNPGKSREDIFRTILKEGNTNEEEGIGEEDGFGFEMEDFDF